MTDEDVGTLKEITHDAKVTKEILKVGEGKRLKMGYKAVIRYRAYFLKDHLIFDTTPEDGKGETIELALGDHSSPDGLQTGVEKMRKGEISKIRIKRKHGFGRPLRVEELNFPEGYTEEGPKRTRLTTETIIYEVELVDFIVRNDIEANGIFLKYPDHPAEKNEWETPKDRDEIMYDFELKQGEITLLSIAKQEINM
jgi:hypothetical protein